MKRLFSKKGTMVLWRRPFKRYVCNPKGLKVLTAIMIIVCLGTTSAFGQFTVYQNGSTVVPNINKSLTAVYESAQRIGSEARNGSTVIYARNNNNPKTYYKFQGETFMGTTTSTSDAYNHLDAWQKAYVFCSDGSIYGARTGGKNNQWLASTGVELSPSYASKRSNNLPYNFHSLTITVDLSNTAYFRQGSEATYPSENFYIYGDLAWDNWDKVFEWGLIKDSYTGNNWKVFAGGKNTNSGSPANYFVPSNSSNVILEWRLEYNQFKFLINGTVVHSVTCNEEYIRTHNPQFATMVSMCPDYVNNEAAKISDFCDGAFLGPVKLKNCKINFTDNSSWNFWKSDAAEVIYAGGGNDYVWESILEEIIDSQIIYSENFGYKNTPLVVDYLEKIRKVNIEKNFSPCEIYGEKFLCRQYSDTITPSPSSILYNGNIYVLANGSIYSSTLAFISVCNRVERLVTVGQPSGYFVGRSSTPFFLSLPNSKLIFWLVPVLDMSAVKTTQDHYDFYRDIFVDEDINHYVYKLYFGISLKGDIYSKDFLYNHDPVFQKVLEIK